MTMLKQIGKILSVLLLVSLLIVGTSAAFPDQDKITHSTAVNRCTVLGIIRGREDGSFDPQGVATRAEMAKMICIILNGGKEPVLGVGGRASFSDTRGHWAEAYIEYCSSLGIVSGMGDGSFNPNGRVTGTQASKMLLVALGFDAAYEGYNGLHWSLRINIAANQKHFYDEMTINPDAPLQRDSAAQLIWNALNATMVKYTYGLSSVGGSLHGIKFAGEYIDERSLLSFHFKEADYSGRLSKFTYNAWKKEFTYTLAQPSGSPSSMSFTTQQDYTSLYGQAVTVVYRSVDSRVEKVYGIYAEDSRVLFSGVLHELELKSDRVIFGGSSYDLDSKTTAGTKAHPFLYNTAFDLTHGTALTALDETQMTYSFDAIDEDKDGKVDFLITYPYTVKKVSFVGSQRVTVGSTAYYYADSEIYEGIQIGDYSKIISAAHSPNNTPRLERVQQMLTGKVTRQSDKRYYIDEVAYTLAPGLSLSVGDMVKDAAVVNKVIFAAKVYRLTIEDYAVVVNAVPSSANGLLGHQAKLLFFDGTTRIVNTREDYLSLKGQLVTYSSNREGEYRLQGADFSSPMGTSFDKAILPGADKVTSSKGSDKVTYLDQCLIADDAVIFLRQGDGSGEKPFSYSILSGAKVKTASKAGVSLLGAFGVEHATGFSTVKLAFLSSVEPLTKGETQYGYALSDFAYVQNSEGEAVCEYSLWNGSAAITVQGVAGLEISVSKGDVLSYQTNLDGALTAITVYKTKVAPAAQIAAITAFDEERIQLDGLADSLGIDENTVILYVDNEAEIGLAEGSFHLADQAEGGSYIPNALVLHNGSIVRLLVIDINNDICGLI